MLSQLFAAMITFWAVGQIDWSQPPMAPLNDVVPAMPEIACLDLSQLPDPGKDLPPNLSEEEKKFWTVEHSRELRMCRYLEALKREEQKPGSMRPALVEVAWMSVNATLNREQKIQALLESARRFDMPAPVLAGALMQESLMSELGIADDGGNYSCGIGQINVIEWCRWAQGLSSAEQQVIAWPATGRSADVCGMLTSNLIEPFYNIAITRLGGLPRYRLTSKHFEGITYEQVQGKIPKAFSELQFKIATSFIHHCSFIEYGIPAKAHELAWIFNNYVPEALRNAQQSTDGNPWPLHTGWLMADAVYNAGPVMAEAVRYYLNGSPWAALSPQDLIEAIYGAGKYNPDNKRLEFVDSNNQRRSLSWYKSCVAQRHIAGVVQYVSAKGAKLAYSYEGDAGCSKTTVPLARQKLPGRRNVKH